MSLEKIAQLTERIGPLSRKSRGMRIEAEEWNTLVETVRGILEIDRAQERGGTATLEENFSRRGHQHLGEVALDWLDPDLQERFATGGGSLSARSQIAQLEEKVAGLATQVARLASLVESQQRAIDSAAVEELDRSRRLRELGERFSGIEDLRTSLTVLNGEVTGLTRNVDQVLELRAGLLDPQGELVDLSAVQEQVTDLQSLRENLEGVDGSLVRMRDMEVRMRDIEDAVGLGAGDGLEGRFADLSTNLETSMIARVDERVGTARGELTTESETRTNELRSDLETMIASESGRLEEDSRSRVDAAEARLAATVGERVTSATGEAETRILTASAQLVDERVSGLDGTIADSVASARTEIESTLQASLGERLERLTEDRVEEMSGGLREELDLLSESVAAIDEGLPARVQDVVAGEAEAISDRVSGEVDTKVAAARTAMRAEIQPQVAAAVDEATAGIDGRIDQRVSVRLAGVDGQIENTVTAHLAQLPDEIDREVSRQLEQNDFPGQIAFAVDRSRTELRSELAQTTAVLRAERSTSISNTTTMLRGEIAVARRAASDDAVERSSVIIDQRNNALEAKLTADPGRVVVTEGGRITGGLVVNRGGVLRGGG